MPQTPLLSDEMCQRLHVLHKRHAGLAECMLAVVYQHILKPGDQFLDAGGRVGAHSRPLSRLTGPEGRGAVFEPNPASQEKLRALIAAHPHMANTTLVPAAVADHVGRASFYCRDTHDGWSSLFADHAPEGDDEAPHQIDVDVTTLDATAADLGLDHVRFIKIDVEDAEYAALLGAEALMRSQRPVIAFENRPHEAVARGGYTPEDFFALFEGRGYDLVDMFWRPFDLARFHTQSDLPYYYFATPQETELHNLVPDALYLGRLMQHARRLEQGFAP